MTMTTTAAAAASSSAGWLSLCEISGEPLSSSPDPSSLAASAVVVTPSGHICLQRFLALKLSDNGSVDPFTGAPLALEDCVVLKPPQQAKNSSTASNLPSTTSSSFTQSLQQLQRDYDAVLLELFDTRQVLHSTRKELSQALYQQDAALRVIARLIQEKEQPQKSHNDNSGGAEEAVVAPSTGGSKKRARIDVIDHEVSMSTKTPPPTPTAATTTTTITTATAANLPRIPADDLTVMHTAWLQLSKSRKSMVQQAAKQVVTTLSSFGLVPLSKLSSISLSSVVAAKAWESQYQIVVGATTSSSSPSSLLQMVVWNEAKSLEQSPTIVELPKTISGSSVVVLDVQPPHAVLVAQSKKEVWLGLYNLTTKTLASTTVPPPEEDASSTATLTQVQLHPSGQHVMLTYSTGVVVLYRLEPNHDNQVSLVRLSHWQPFVATTPYTSSHMVSALHPDGYLHAITKNSATEAPVIYLYEFKEHNVALTLSLAPEATTTTTTTTLSTITTLAFSPNGYHVALAVWQQPPQDEDNNKTEGTAKLTLWDLRKSTIVHTLTLPSSTTSSEYPTTSRPVVQLTFDPSGKSLAYALDNGTVGCTNFKNKTTLNEPVLLYLPPTSIASTTSTPSSLSWPMANRIVVTYQTTELETTSKNDSDMEEEEDDDFEKEGGATNVICVLEAPTSAN